MASAKMTVRETVTIESHQCGECGLWFGMEAGFIRARQADKQTWFCPNGHPRAFVGETAEEKAKKALTRAEERLKWYSDRLDVERREREAAENSLRTTKGHLTRAKNRAVAGVCQDCNRTFQNVARHNHTKHGASHDQAACKICQPEMLSGE